MRAHDSVGVLPQLGHGVDVTGLERFVERLVGFEDRLAFRLRHGERRVLRDLLRDLPGDPPRECPTPPLPSLPWHFRCPTGCRRPRSSRSSRARSRSGSPRSTSCPSRPRPGPRKGTLVHRALELLFVEPARPRTLDAALAGSTAPTTECGTRSRVSSTCDLSRRGGAAVPRRRRAAGAPLLRARRPHATCTRSALELQLEAEVGGTTLRGIIDRLELDDDGELVVTDYKTGRPPGQRYEQAGWAASTSTRSCASRCFGRRPARVQLLYLQRAVAIIADAVRAVDAGSCAKTVGAIWTAVERACERDDFRPRRGPLCDYCAYKAYCPAFGGDPALARQHELRRASRARTRASCRRACPTPPFGPDRRSVRRSR